MEKRLIRHWITTLFVLISVVSQTSARKNKNKIIEVTDKSQTCTIPSNDTLQGVKRKPRSLPPPSCVLPIKSFTSGRVAVGSVSRPNGQFPPWMDVKLAQQGQRVGRKYFAQFGFSSVLGLLFIIMIPHGNDVLLMTRKSDTPEGVKLRYTATMGQVKLWYEDDIVSKDQSSDSPILTSLAKVRSFHVAAAERAADLRAQNKPLFDESIYKDVKIDEGFWQAYDTDLKNVRVPESAKDFPPEYYEIVQDDAHAQPVNQFLLAMTQFAFVGFPVGFPERCGLKFATAEELWAVNHLWAVLGYCLGIEDQYNIALQPDLNATQIYYRQFFEKFYFPILFKLKFTTKVLVEALLKGFNGLVLGLSANVQMYRLLAHGCKIPAPNIKKRFTVDEEIAEAAFSLQEADAYQANPFITGSTNLIASNQIDSLGVQMYGAKYLNKKSRANTVFYA